MRRLSRNRRGAVLPLVAVIIAALAMLIAFVFDFSRAYAQKNELQTMADAAAHSGVIELYKDADNVANAGYFIGAHNEVLMRVLPAGNADFECGVWDEQALTFTSDNAPCGGGHDAVRATVRDTVNWIFPLLMGVAPKQITATATAWMGYVDITSCVKPWSMPYSLLSSILDPGWPQVKACVENGGTDCNQFLQKDPDRVLDDEDMEELRTRDRDDLRFRLKLGSPPDEPGNFGTLDIPNPDESGGGGNLYRTNIATCNSTRLGRDSIVYTQTGNMVGPTLQGSRLLCQPLTPNGGGECQDGNGNMGKEVVAALWASMTPKTGGTYEVKIRQLVSFSLDTVTSQAEIIGHFIPGAFGGSISPIPSTLQRPVIVE